MAMRRMFSLKIINSARFLKMPISSQLLYFHLGLHADDDGIVEGYNVIKMLGCSEDDLKILVAKGFIIVLNEDLVSFITDWKEHNLIRADRKVDSIYKDLLLRIVSDIKLIESKPRADLKPKISDIYEENGRPVDNQRTEMDGIGKDRLGKVRIGKDSIYSDEFEKFYSIYPNAVNKQLTYKNYLKSIKQDSEDIILQATNNYISYVESKGTEKQYIFKSTNFVGQHEEYKNYIDCEPIQIEKPYWANVDG